MSLALGDREGGDLGEGTTGWANCVPSAQLFVATVVGTRETPTLAAGAHVGKGGVSRGGRFGPRAQAVAQFPWNLEGPLPPWPYLETP